MNDLEHLDPELGDLFAKERSEHVSEPMIRDEILERVERAIRMAALAPAAAAGTKAAAAVTFGTKAVVGVALVIAFGGGVIVGRETAPAGSTGPAITATAASTSSPSSGASSASLEAPATPVSDLPSASATPARPVPAPASTPSAPPSDLAKEQALIDTARSALARGRGADALAAAEAHATRVPRGALAEEREALAVQALVLDGKADAARSRAAQFHRRYPTSIFRPSVERAISGL